MNKYLRAYKLGYLEGLKDIRKNIKFVKINEMEILSKLYDLGYIDGYKLKNKPLKNKSFIV